MTPRPRRAAVGGALGALALALALAPPAAGAMPTAKGPAVIDGPSADIVSPVGLMSAIARDGTGALVYLKDVGGVPHVFASALVGGIFAPPVQLDPGLGAPSAQPVVAAAPGGAVTIAFLNAGGLWAVTRPDATAPLGAPRLIAPGAASPALAMTALGKAYLAFTLADGTGSDVRAAYFDTRVWSLESAPLNITPGDDAGSGGGRPAVTAAGDGVALVAWGERGHVWARRVTGTSPSLVGTQADSPPPGCTESSADAPAIGSGGDSSYAALAFREAVVCSGQPSSRVISVRLRGHVAERLSTADGLPTPSPQSAGAPALAVGEFGHGWIVATQSPSNGVAAQGLGENATPSGASFTANGEPNASAPDPAPAVAGFASNLIAWQHDPGPTGAPEIRLRYADQGNLLNPEIVLSAPAQGPTDAGDGLTAGGNVLGEAAVAWVQGPAGSRAIIADLLLQPPGAPEPVAAGRYVRVARPALAWTASNELWGPVTYNVAVDGGPVSQTQDTAYTPPAPLGEGPHTWGVSAVNSVGLASGTRTSAFFLDTVAPQVGLALSGRRLAKERVRLRLTATDAPPPLNPADSSGIARITITWGDGTPATSRARLHAYAKPGRYRIRVVVADRAGNLTAASLVLRIKPKPKPKPGPKPTSPAPALGRRP